MYAAIKILQKKLCNNASNKNSPRANPVHCPSSMASITNISNTRTHGAYIDHSLPDVLFDVYKQYAQHCKAQHLHWDDLEKHLQQTERELCCITHIVLQPWHVHVRTRNESHPSTTTRCLVENACARFIENKFYSLRKKSEHATAEHANAEHANAPNPQKIEIESTYCICC